MLSWLCGALNSPGCMNEPDLFATPEPVKSELRVYSVSEVTKAVRGVIEDQFPGIWVEGEVSNYRQQSSGHQYFTLKDAGSQLSCVMFARPGMWRKAVPLSDGMMVQAKGKLTVYEARGQYQMTVSLVQAGGAGLLQAKFEALKRKLAAEGLFEADQKRTLPEYPLTLAIITSPTGAALQDILNILSRRAPWLRVIIAPVRVQGDGAAAEMVEALEDINRETGRGLPKIDVVLLTRGGGSAEDLWEFNDEALARTIAGSSIPTVSAVGHEIDFTIADLVADLRAPTPSAAAELIAPDTGELMRRIDGITGHLRKQLMLSWERASRRLGAVSQSAVFREPQNRVQQYAQRLDFIQTSFSRAGQDRLQNLRQRLDQAGARLRQHRPDQILALRRQQSVSLGDRLGEQLRRQLRARGERLQRLGEMLRLLSPEATLERGYSLAMKADGTLLRSAKDVRADDALEIRLKDGTVKTVVK